MVLASHTDQGDAMIATTTRKYVASAKVPGMINVEIVITHVQTGPAETYMIQAVSPTRMGAKDFQETEEDARTSANAMWATLKRLAVEEGITTLAHGTARQTATAIVSEPATVAPAGPVPAGRYAVEREGVIKFYVVDHGKGRWDGYTFVSVQASDDTYAVRNRAERESILAAIAVDPREAMARYGREIGSCGHCGRTLTDEESRAYGIGPVCRDKI